jgi:hypothetical protein
MHEQKLSIIDLRDIVIPEPVGLWPPALFVWVLLGAVCLGLALLIWRWVARWRAGAYRREGLARLSQIEGRLLSQGKEAAALADLSILLKRVALAAFPRKQVAPLYGEKWLEFLDSTCKDCKFSSGPGQLLIAATDTRIKEITVHSNDGKQLVRLAGVWIKRHQVIPT